MGRLLDIVIALLRVAAACAALAVVVPVTPVHAAVGDACIVPVSLVPGEIDGADTCIATSPAPAVGFDCGNDLYVDFRRELTRDFHREVTRL